IDETSLNVTRDHMELFGEWLGWQKPSETQRKQRVVNFFAELGIVDRATLLSYGIPSFARAEFEGIGKGGALTSWIFPDREGYEVSVEMLEKIATWLGWENEYQKLYKKLTHPEKVQHWREMLEAENVDNRKALI